MKNATVKSQALLAAILAVILCITVFPAATAEEDMLLFEEKGVYVKIPDSVMYVTRESPDTAPLFSILGSSGMSYDQFLQYMQENQMFIYGLMLTDYRSEFSLVIDDLANPVSLNDSTDALMNVYLNQAKKQLENLGAKVTDYSVYTGELYKGFRFLYTLENEGSTQHVIQYSIIDGIRTVNIRVYGFDGEFSEENEKIIQQIYDTIMIVRPENAISAPGGESSAAEKLKSYEEFEDVAINVEIPDSIMYVTMYSDKDAPLYSLLAQIGFTYDSFREFMSTNKIAAYGLFLTDNETEFQIAADRINMEFDLAEATETKLQSLLATAESGLTGKNARIEESGIYKGKNYTGFWFHYQIEANGAMQGVIQYTVLHNDRAVNIRGYNPNGEYPEEIEEIIKKVFDSVIVK